MPERKSSSAIAELDRSRHVREAVRSLRIGLGETQPQFAARLGVSFPTTVRYELTHAPHGRMLVKLTQIAQENRFTELARVFENALRKELGIVAIGDTIGHLSNPHPERRKNPHPPHLVRPEELPQAYAEYVKSITRSGIHTITSIGLYFERSDGIRIVADVALPED